jgi:hypothetical protein
VLRTPTILASMVGVLPTAGAVSCLEAVLDACEGTVSAVFDDRAFLRSCAKL